MKHMLFIYKYKYQIAFTIGVLFLLSGCKSAELKEVENSASILQLTTGHEVRRWHQDKGIALGKPVYTKLWIGYEPINHYTKEDVFNEIIATLEKNNWEKDKSNFVPDYFTASLQQDQFRITAAVFYYPDENLIAIYFEAH